MRSIIGQVAILVGLSPGRVTEQADDYAQQPIGAGRLYYPRLSVVSLDSQ